MASFVYLGAPDETAHVLGCGATYEAAIRRADAGLGGLLAAVRSRASYADEQWTFLVVTDHGHVDAGGHGGRTPGSAPRGWPRRAPASARHRVRCGTPTSRPRCSPSSAATPTGTGRWSRPFAAAPHAVLLDMDGTLVDTESLWLRTVREAVPRIGTDDLFDVLGRSATETATRLRPLTGGDPTPWPPTWKPASWRPSSARPCRSPAPLELLDLLRESGIPAALVSASSRPVLDAVLKTLGADRFRTTVAEGETPRTKPAADPYLAAARALGVDPAACLAVEDSPTGVAAAEAAGCRVLAVPSYAPIEPGPRRTVRRGLEGIGRRELWSAGL